MYCAGDHVTAHSPVGAAVLWDIRILQGAEQNCSSHRCHRRRGFCLRALLHIVLMKPCLDGVRLHTLGQDRTRLRLSDSFCACRAGTCCQGTPCCKAHHAPCAITATPAERQWMHHCSNSVSAQQQQTNSSSHKGWASCLYPSTLAGLPADLSEHSEAVVRRAVRVHSGLHRAAVIQYRQGQVVELSRSRFDR